MKKKFFGSLIVLTTITLVSVNLSAGLFPNGFENVSLKSLESLAKGEDSSEWTKLQVGLCPDGIGLGKACVPSPFYESTCNKWEEVDCFGKLYPEF